MTAIGDFKTGDRFEFTRTHGNYGYYKNGVVTNVRLTKTGKIQLTYNCIYVSPKGEEKECLNQKTRVYAPHTELSFKPI